MEIPQEIRREIGRLSHEGNHDKLARYIQEQLYSETINADQILNYARNYKFTKTQGKPYVINADTINKIGARVGKLKDKIQSNLAAEFYRLAARRQSSWGNKNYAACLLIGSRGITRNQKKALLYAQKAVEPSQDNLARKNVHKLILAKALKVNDLSPETIVACEEFIEFKLKEKATAKGKNKVSIKKEIEEANAIKVLKNINKPSFAIVILQQINFNNDGALQSLHGHKLLFIV